MTATFSSCVWVAQMARILNGTTKISAMTLTINLLFRVLLFLFVLL